jgi:hypothetical protein
MIDLLRGTVLFLVQVDVVSLALPGVRFFVRAVAPRKSAEA